MRGLSGAVTAMILVIASAVIALVVVGYAFGLFGTMSSQGVVTPEGGGVVNVNGTAVTVHVVLNDQSPFNYTVVSVMVNDLPLHTSQLPVVVKPGTNYLTFKGDYTAKLTPGEYVDVEVVLSNGQTVVVPAVVQ